MRSVYQWFGEYGESHSHPVNELLHFLCVPPIVLSVMGFIWAIPVPDALAAKSIWLNWATLAVALAIPYYFMLSAPLGVGASIALVAMLFMVSWLDTLAWPLWATCLVIFVVGWIGQFLGHAKEGRRPSFFKDLQFLLIGPLWLLSHLYRRLGIRF
jgi:uncharacterized membrane protein YGL010W